MSETNKKERRTEELYLRSTEYNIARLLTKLAEIVTENGGKVIVDSYTPHYILHNRSVMERLKEVERKIQWFEQFGENAKNPDYWLAFYEEKKQLENMALPVVETDQKSYIKFDYKGIYYYFQSDSNPFFGCKYMKYPKGTDSQTRYLEDYETKERIVWYDYMWSYKDASDEKVNILAHQLFDELVNARQSGIVPQSVFNRNKVAGRGKIKVKNTYNDSYHYEYV